MRHSDAYDYCEDEGMGLAMWHTAELYEDIKYLAFKADSDLHTALTNKENEYCASKDDCHGKLIWQQEENGAEEYFETHTAYNLITAKTSLTNLFRVQIFRKNSEVNGIKYYKTHPKAVCGGKRTILCL